jgi:16S rRNA (guanine527-N7)-methyltransferase
VFVELLAERLQGVCRLSPGQLARLERHYELLVRWNQVLNLTSIRATDAAVERHYCESLFLGAHLPGSAVRIADVGSGAGFPGTPLAVMRPDCSVTLIESHRRKAAFLRESTRDLANVRVLAERAEAVPESFDVVVSRAVKVEEVASTLVRLAPRVMLLAGAEVCQIPVVWQPPVPLPWGKQRFLWIGDVSRET